MSLAKAIREDLLRRSLLYTTDGPVTLACKEVLCDILAPSDAELNEIMEREQAKNGPAEPSDLAQDQASAA